MSTYYTSKYSGEQIDEAVRKILDGEMTGDYADRQLSNLDTPQGALANLGAGVRPSLLVNGDFRAGHVVNQRGQTSYSGTYAVYTVDGWLLNQSGTATLNVLSDGVQIVAGTSTAQFRQYLESLPDGVYTLSFLFADGSLGYAVYEKSGTAYTRKDYAGSDVWGLGMQDTSGKPTAFMYAQAGMSAAPVASKLESGEGQTLAYQDDTGAWQLLPQPESDYATQLAKCQRYYLPINEMQYRAGQMGTGWIGFPIPTPVTMRTNPTLVGTANIKTVTGTTQSRFAISFVLRAGIVRAYATKTSHGLTDAVIAFESGSALSAEL